MFKMPSPYKVTEARVTKACEAARGQRKPNITALAREYDVPYTRLRSRFKGVSSRLARESTNKRLNSAQETAVIQWMRQVDSLYVSPTANMIAQCANQVVAASSDASPRRLDRNWVYRFRGQLPKDMAFTKQKKVEKNRISTEDVSTWTHWFKCLEPFIAKIPPKNIYNLDEIGIRIGQGKPQNVVTMKPSRVSNIPIGEQHETVAAIEFVAANGDSFPPFFIVKGEPQFDQRLLDPLPDAYGIGTSSTGNVSDSHALEWIQHFHNHTKSRVSKREHRLLLMNGHSSNLTFEILKFCNKNRIIPYCFVPHAKHTAQPLDDQPFVAYKQHYQQLNNRITQPGEEGLDMSGFFREVASARKETFNSRAIRSAFATCGIYPYNPSKILEPLHGRVSAIPTPQPIPEPQRNVNIDDTTTSSSSSSIGSPIQSPRNAQHSANNITQHLDSEDIVPPAFEFQVRRAVYRSIAASDFVPLLARDLWKDLQHERAS